MMKNIQTNKAFYIKLGLKGGYESECLTIPGTARVSWADVSSAMVDGGPDQIHWEAIKTQQNHPCKNKGMATNQTPSPSIRARTQCIGK